MVEKASTSRLGEEAVTGLSCSPSEAFPEEREGAAQQWVDSSDRIWQNGNPVGAGRRSRRGSQGGGETVAQSFQLGGPCGHAFIGRSEECGPWHPDTYQAHLASPSALRQLAPVMLNNQSSPHDHSMESGSSQAAQRPACGLRERKGDGRQTFE